METNGGRPYFEGSLQARRWFEAVDWGSPRSAWCDEMLATPPEERTMQRLAEIRRNRDSKIA